MKTCPKCQYSRTAADAGAPDDRCPSCGVIYAKIGRAYVPPKRPPPAAFDWRGHAEPAWVLIKQAGGAAIRTASGLIAWADSVNHPAVTADDTPRPAVVDKPRPDAATILLAQTEAARFKTSHVLHFFLSLFSAGLWLLVWLIVAASNTRERNRIYARCSIAPESNMAYGVSLLIMGLAVMFLMLKLFVWHH